MLPHRARAEKRSGPHKGCFIGELRTRAWQIACERVICRCIRPISVYVQTFCVESWKLRAFSCVPAFRRAPTKRVGQTQETAH